MLARYGIAPPDAIAHALADPLNETLKPGAAELRQTRFEIVARPQASLDAAAVCPARQGDTLLAALKDLESADDAQFKIEVDAIADRDARSAAEKQAALDAEAAARARGQAIGGFIYGLVGGGTTPAATTPNPAASAPVPAPAPKGT